jgi:hypothetical protein
VNFKYTVETTSKTTNPDTVLPELEETLLKKLAEKLLNKNCVNPNEDRSLPPPSERTGSTASTASTEGKGGTGGKGTRFRRRKLVTRTRRLETLGICSTPEDKHVSEGKKSYLSSTFQ